MGLRPVTRYVRDVLSGREPAGPHVRDACERHRRDLKRKDIFFDHDQADRAIGFFHDLLRFAEGRFTDREFTLHCSQQFIVGSIFGWQLRQKGVPKKHSVRRFRRAYIEQAKGTGKTPLAAGITLYGMIADGEAGGNNYIAASTGEQARICFEDARSMLEASPELLPMVTLVGRKPCKKIMYVDGSPKPSTIEPVTTTIATRGSGFRPHFVVLDELHEHKDGQILESLERGFKWRTQPLLFMITNSGADYQSVCYEEHEHAIAVARGTREDDTTFAYVCASDEGDDPLDLSQSDEVLKRIWRKTNPLLDVTIESDYLRKQAEQAVAIPGRRNRILRWNFCQWTQSEDAWIDRNMWLAVETDDDLLARYRSREVYCGVDLSSTTDLTAIAYVWRTGVTDEGKATYAASVHSYTPEDTLVERSRVDRTHYDAWVDLGHMFATPGTKISYEYVAAKFAETVREAEKVQVAYDSWSYDRFAHALEDAMAGREVEQVQHPQGPNRSKSSDLHMPSSIDQLETLILEGRIEVQVNPPLRSAVDSATFAQTSSGLRRFDKRRATNRIDPLVALTMAVGLASLPELTPTDWSPFADMDDEAFDELYDLA